MSQMFFSKAWRAKSAHSSQIYGGAQRVCLTDLRHATDATSEKTFSSISILMIVENATWNLKFLMKFAIVCRKGRPETGRRDAAGVRTPQLPAQAARGRRLEEQHQRSSGTHFDSAHDSVYLLDICDSIGKW